MKQSIAIVIEIVKKEFHQIRQDKRMLLLSFMAPLLQVLLLGYSATTDIKYSTMVVCDMDKTAASREFIERFTTSGYFVHGYSVDVPGGIDCFIEHGKAAVALVIPPQFAAMVAARRTVPVQMIFDGTDANSANIVLGYATQIAAQYSQSIVQQTSMRQPVRTTGRIVPDLRIWFNPDLKSSNYMVPGVVAFVLMIITMTLTSLGLVKERELGTLEQLMVTPIKPYQLIIGKLIPFVIIGFIDVVGVLAIARFWFGVPMHGNLLVLFFLSGLFILTTLGLGLFISTIARTQQQAMLIAQFFFLMPFIFLSGFTFPIANMPVIIQYVTYLIPLRYFLEIVRGIFLKGSGLAELWPQAVALLSFGIIILSLSVMRFEKKLG